MKSKYEIIFDIVADGIIILNAETLDIFMVNKKICQMLEIFKRRITKIKHKRY